MSNTDEAVRWFRQAEHDLATARATTVAGSYDWACFQAQQGAEKALKALLYGKGYRKILTHSVYELLIETKQAGYDLGDLHTGGKRLDQVYISARYPNGILGTLIPENITERRMQRNVSGLQDRYWTRSGIISGTRGETSDPC